MNLRELTGTQTDAAYSPQLFEQLAHVWSTKLSHHLQEMMAAQTRVLNWTDPPDLVHAAEAWLTSSDSDSTASDHLTRFGQLIDDMLAHGQNLHHPHYIGHQVPASSPVAGLFDGVGAIANQPMAIFEMGPWATAVEHALVRRLLGKVGWSADSGAGLLTSGGSLANLTALLTARNVRFPDSWENGLPKSVVLVVNADAHYCVARSAGILGIGTNNILPVPLDAQRRMQPDALHSCLQQAEQAGQQVMAVVACACATPIGAFDPLREIADVCRRHDVWLHVDAAHGGSVLMSRSHQHLLDGIDAADSLVWDAHKMMFVPALCAAVLYRNRDHRFEAFQQNAPYLFDPSNPGMAEYESGMRTLECTKRSLGFSLWGLWAMFGERLFEELVDQTFRIARTFHARLSETTDFEVLQKPQANIVVFRHLPAAIRTASLPDQNSFHQQLRTRLVRSGEFYIVQTKIDGVSALRMTFMNPQTNTPHLTGVMDAIRRFGQEVLAEWSENSRSKDVT